MNETITNPQNDLLVTAITVGDIGARVTGYYHYEPDTRKYYVCLQESLVMKEVIPKTIEVCK